MKALGIVLIVLGLGLTIFTAVKFFTTEKVVEIGKLEITRDKPHYYSWSPVIGIVIAVAGGAILFKSTAK